MNKFTVKGVDEQVIGRLETGRHFDNAEQPEEVPICGKFPYGGPDTNIAGKKKVIADPFEWIVSKFRTNIRFAFVDDGIEVFWL
jgi:hypothetical protein